MPLCCAVLPHAPPKACDPTCKILKICTKLPLGPPLCRHPAVLSYLMRSLEACDPEEVAFFLPQLVQVRMSNPCISGTKPGTKRSKAVGS